MYSTLLVITSFWVFNYMYNFNILKFGFSNLGIVEMLYIDFI